MRIQSQLREELRDADELVNRLLSPFTLSAVVARAYEDGADDKVHAYAAYIGHVRLIRELLELKALDRSAQYTLALGLHRQGKGVRQSLDQLDAWRHAAQLPDWMSETTGRS